MSLTFVGGAVTIGATCVRAWAEVAPALCNSLLLKWRGYRNRWGRGRVDVMHCDYVCPGTCVALILIHCVIWRLKLFCCSHWQHCREVLPCSCGVAQAIALGMHMQKPNSASNCNELNASCAVADCMGAASEIVQKLCGTVRPRGAHTEKRVFAIKSHWANKCHVNIVQNA